MKNKIIMGVVVLSVVSGCATVEEKMQSKYGSPLKEFNYEDDSYNVVVNDKTKEILVKENDSTAEKLFSPKYGAIGVIIDATDVLGRNDKFRGIADNYLSKNQPGCKTIEGKIEKCNVECYEFEYACNAIAQPKEAIKPYVVNDLIKSVTPEIKSTVSLSQPIANKDVKPFNGIEIKGVHIGMP